MLPMSLINYSFLFGVLIRDKPKIDFELNFNFYEYLNKSCDNEGSVYLVVKTTLEQLPKGSAERLKKLRQTTLPPRDTERKKGCRKNKTLKSHHITPNNPYYFNNFF